MLSIFDKTLEFRTGRAEPVRRGPTEYEMDRAE